MVVALSTAAVLVIANPEEGELNRGAIIINDQLQGRVQGGEGNASHWLSRFNAAYARKIGVPIFPGSLNLALPEPFDWFAPDVERRIVRFERGEYGGDRDILLVPCLLTNLASEPGWLWTTTTARTRDDSLVIEIIASRNLREAFGLADGSVVDVRLLDQPQRGG